jgi:hypothetical protein
MKTITFPNSPYLLHQPFEPAGDQPKAIAQLVEGINNGLAYQTLLGVTGSGKTFSIADIVHDRFHVAKYLGKAVYGAQTRTHHAVSSGHAADGQQAVASLQSYH